MLPEEKSDAFPALESVTSEPQGAATDVRANRVEDYLHGVSAGNQHRRSRSRSLFQSFAESSPPLGMWQATGEVGSKIPTLPEIHDGSFGVDGWSQEGQLEHRGASSLEAHRRAMRARKSSFLRDSAHSGTTSSNVVVTADSPQHETLQEESVIGDPNGDAGAPLQLAFQLNNNLKHDQIISMQNINGESIVGPDETGKYPNGYRFPKKHTWAQSISIGLKAFWKFFLTPMGFIITIYGLNVVGWGAMIFLLLLEAAPAMCHPSCGNMYSARKIWIEIDGQVLTALFCVTGFGLIPWRIRDTYYLMRWRWGGNQRYHRKLAGINRSWYRLPGSNRLPEHIGPPPVYNKKRPRGEDDPPPCSAEEIRELEDNDALPMPPTSIPDPPLTGVRAQPTKPWKMDLLIWTYVANTLVQIGLAGMMWGLSRFLRPSWATGFLISIGCFTGIVACVVVFVEGSKIKKVEGIPVREYDIMETAQDYQKRRAKEDAKQSRKQRNLPYTAQLQSNRTEKVKGSSWFTRY